MSSRTINLGLLIAVAAVIPIAIVFAIIIIYGVNVPFHDQWALVSFFEKDLNGQLSYRDFWRPHNEHLTPFSIVIQFHLAKLTAWNSKYAMLVSLALAVTTYGLLGYLLRSSVNSVMVTNTTESKYTIATSSVFTLTVLIAFAFFSINQWENWLWGWQVQWFIHILGLLLVFSALNLAQRQKKLVHGITFLGAIFGAILTTFSLASGILIWVVAIPMFFMAKHLQKYLIPWLGCFGISFFLTQSLTGRKSESFSQLITQLDFIEFSKFVFAFLASALRPYQALGILLLILSVAAVVVSIVLYKSNLKVVMPWILLGTYIVATGAIISIGRSHYGFIGGGSPRYATLSNIAFICLMVLLFLIIIRLRYSQILLNSIFVIVLLSMAFSSHHAATWIKIRHSQMLLAQHCLKTHSVANDACLQKLFPHVGMLKNWIFVLEHLGYVNLENKIDTYATSQRQNLIGVGESITIEGSVQKSGVFHQDENSLSRKDLNAYGTWIDSDANVGRIDWKLETDKAITSFETIVFEYTTGPSVENLYINILDKNDIPVYKFDLQEARAWTKVEININDLDWDGEGPLSLNVIDNGNGWGQWIAVLQPSFRRAF